MTAIKKGISVFLAFVLLAALLLAAAPPAYAASNPDNFIFDITDAPIVISQNPNGTLKVVYGEGGLNQEKDNIPAGQQITIIGTVNMNTTWVNYLENNALPNEEIVVLSVLPGVTCSIAIENLSIDVSPATKRICAFKLGQGSNVTLEIKEDNTLKSGFDQPGIKTTGASLLITGSGNLTAAGGQYGAGIGGAKFGDGGTITINGSGNVTATGGEYGAGIGGGEFGSSGTITINGGGNITATGGENGAGIGAGSQSAGGTITISCAGNVTAKGGDKGAGIGGGESGDSGTIIINGTGYVTATGGQWAAGIGGGYNGNGNAITISGGTEKPRAVWMPRASAADIPVTAD